MNEAQLRNMTIDELISAYECGQASADEVMPRMSEKIEEHKEKQREQVKSIQDEIRSAIDTLEDCL